MKMIKLFMRAGKNRIGKTCNPTSDLEDNLEKHTNNAD